MLADRLIKPLLNIKFKCFVKFLSLKLKEDIIYKNFKN